MSKITDLLDKAKRAITAGETHFRFAADHLAQARKLGASQRQSAKAIGRSAAWVCQLLKWHDSGYKTTPFGPQTKDRDARRAACSGPKHLPRLAAPLTTPEKVAHYEAQRAESEARTARAMAVAIAFSGGATVSYGQRAQLVAALMMLPPSHPAERARAAIGMSWDALLVPAAAESKQDKAA